MNGELTCRVLGYQSLHAHLLNISNSGRNLDRATRKMISSVLVSSCALKDKRLPQRERRVDPPSRC